MTRIDISLIQNAGDMIQLALQINNIPVKELAMITECSPDTWYAVGKGIRSIPTRCKKVVARKGIMFMLALCLEATGCKIFAYQKINRDIQSLLTGLEIQNEKTAEYLKILRKLLWNKNNRQDLTEEEFEMLEAAIRSIIAHVCAAFNLLMEIEAKFGTNPAIYMNEIIANKNMIVNKIIFVSQKI